MVKRFCCCYNIIEQFFDGRRDYDACYSSSLDDLGRLDVICFHIMCVVVDIGDV